MLSYDEYASRIAEACALAATAGVSRDTTLELDSLQVLELLVATEELAGKIASSSVLEGVQLACLGDGYELYRRIAG